MKKYLASLIVLAVCLFYTSEIYANVYASGLRISDASVTDYNLATNSWDENFLDGSGVKIWFIVNESGVGTLSATITIFTFSGPATRTINTTVTKGVNSVIWDGYMNGGVAAPVGEFSYSIQVSDPVGHTTFDSVWVASAYYQGPDPDGGTAYAYRGNASVTEWNTPSFGSLFVSRGSSQPPANGFYRYRADGVYVGKVDSLPAWPNSTPNEVACTDEKVFGLAGYGYGSGYSAGFDLGSGTFTDSLVWGNNSIRGLAVYNWLNVYSFYTGKSGGTAAPVVLKTTGSTAPVVVADLSALVAPGNSYIKAVDLDDNMNIYVAFGNASASRKKLAKFNQSGSLLWVDSLEAHGFNSAAIFQSIAIYHGDRLSAADDIIYALIYPGASTGTLAAQWGIYRISLDGSTYTQLVSPVGISSAATSTIINVDAAGNVIWSNGSASERIIQFSPASGPNSFTSSNASAFKIKVTVPVPVELTSFAATVSGKDVVLDWNTASETNNKGFDVEKNSGNGWNVIGFVQGRGTTTNPANYQFIDRNVNGEVYYRLKQMDFDGSFKYSDEVLAKVAVPDGYQLSQNYPNPFNPVTNIRFTLPVDSKVVLEIFNLSGELVATLADDFRSAGEYDISFNASGLASGTYIYRLTADQTVLTRKMILMK
jgi:hypothetical protein